MNRTWLRQIAFFALLYLAISLALDGLIFFLSHIPPRAINLDAVILSLGKIERFLVWPRLLLRMLWPGESTPSLLHYMGPLLDCAVWGALLTSLRRFWIQARK